MSISPPQTYKKMSMDIAVVAVPATTSCGVRKNRVRARRATTPVLRMRLTGGACSRDAG
jgi:hypothetical protein